MRYVNILTIHNEPNYGALLQAYALYSIIESMGYRPRVIDLHMQYRSRDYNLINKVLIYLNNKVKGYDYCYQIAEDFSRIHEPNRIGPFYSYDQLLKFDWNSEDLYIIGSDQVWNTEITHKLKDAFTFSFLPKSCKYKYSYAASFGNIKDEKDRAFQLDIEHTLKTFRRISVREKFGVNFLSKHGIEAKLVVDPTLLLDNYDQLLCDVPHRSGNLLYLPLSTVPKMTTFVESVAKSLNLQIEIRYGYLQPLKTVNKKWASVENWLYRIACSNLVITDSFHATLFSIIFERPFYVYITEPSKAFRISNILRILGLEDHIVNDISQINFEKKIDYVDVKKRLMEYRKSSLEYLSEILKMA